MSFQARGMSLVTRMWIPVIALVITIVLAASFSLYRSVSQIAETSALLERQERQLVLASGLLELLELHAAHAKTGDAQAQAASAQRLQQRLDALRPLLTEGAERQALQQLSPPLESHIKAPGEASLAAVRGPAESLLKLHQQRGAELRVYMGDLRLKNNYITITIMVVIALAVAGATWQLVRTIIHPVQRLAMRAAAIGDGDLTESIAVDRGDELGRLQHALAGMRDNLADMVKRANDGADSVQTAAAEIASGNFDLSQRTENTAARVQETNSAVSDLGVAVRHSAESAATANQLAQQAAQQAAHGGEVVGQVVSTMNEISNSSRRIADIIGTIDGIAFQTNILALNAAVEAARAGEQGRGFAVVAGEVRLLAQRSAEAAKEIKSLIQASVERVEGGTRLVADAGTAIEALVGSVNRVSDVIGEISASTAEQNQHIAGVTSSMVELDQMSQSNAALVEQGAAAAESLKEQAVRLHELVSRYRVAGAGRATPAAKTPQAERTAGSAPATSATRSAAKPLAKPLPQPKPAAAAPHVPAQPKASAPAAGADDDWETF
ncbi:MAG: HAMP domain-containing protein [Burkholderiales bacterium]|nr:HAMP domain-containing protein [Burkholderiales bacterium]